MLYGVVGLSSAPKPQPEAEQERHGEVGEHVLHAQNRGEEQHGIVVKTLKGDADVTGDREDDDQRYDGEDDFHRASNRYTHDQADDEGDKDRDEPRVFGRYHHHLSIISPI